MSNCLNTIEQRKRTVARHSCIMGVGVKWFGTRMGSGGYGQLRVRVFSWPPPTPPPDPPRCRPAAAPATAPVLHRSESPGAVSHAQVADGEGTVLLRPAVLGDGGVPRPPPGQPKGQGKRPGCGCFGKKGSDGD